MKTLFKITPDYERTEHAGASGMYQIMRILKNGVDVTNCIDQGMMFHNESNFEDLRDYLSKIFKMNINDIDCEFDDMADI